MRRRPYVLVVSAMALSACCWHGVERARAEAPSAIVAGRYLAPDGTLVESKAILLSDSKISGIASVDQVEDGTRVARYPNAVVTPGLIDLASSVGSLGQTIASKNAIDPDVHAMDAVDWQHRDFAMARRAGVTSVLIAPAPVNLIAGTAVVAKTDTARPLVLRKDGPMVLSLGPAVMRRDREPTSRQGSLAMLRAALDAARRGEGSVRVRSLVKGGLDSMVYCADAMDVSATLGLFADVAGPNVLVYTGDEHGLADDLSGRGTILVVGPYMFDTAPRVLALAGAMAGRGVPVALAGQMPLQGRDSLRMTAALAVRYGMDPAAARNAITAVAAQAAGVAGRIGTIEPGRDADLVVFSDDPLRLDARVLAVYINGVRVHADHEALRGVSSSE